MELARQAGDELGVARAYMHPAAVLASRREWVLAERYITPGQAFCRERGLQAWEGWLTTLAAEAALALGRLDEAMSTAETILTWPAEGFSHSRISALVLLARVRAQRGEPGYRALLDDAAAIAKTAPVPQDARLIAAARAEITWPEGGSARRIGEETGPGGKSLPVDVRWFGGELEVWRHRAGLDSVDPAGFPSRAGWRSRAIPTARPAGGKRVAARTTRRWRWPARPTRPRCDGRWTYCAASAPAAQLQSWRDDYARWATRGCRAAPGRPPRRIRWA
jgi:hypothetical protein